MQDDTLRKLVGGEFMSVDGLYVALTADRRACMMHDPLNGRYLPLFVSRDLAWRVCGDAAAICVEVRGATLSAYIKATTDEQLKIVCVTDKRANGDLEIRILTHYANVGEA